MTKTSSAAALILFTGFSLALGFEPVPSQAAELGDDSVSVMVKSDPYGGMTGLLRNSGARPVREVRLLIRNTWLWKNETNPGSATDNPGRSSYYVVDGEVPAGGELRFRYEPSPPLPVRNDGSFVSSAEVVGFVEVIEPIMPNEGSAGDLGSP